MTSTFASRYGSQLPVAAPRPEANPAAEGREASGTGRTEAKAG